LFAGFFEQSLFLPMFMKFMSEIENSDLYQTASMLHSINIPLHRRQPLND